MKNTAAIILSILLLFACKQNTKEIDEQQLLGTWETIEGFDFEEITFSIEDDESRVANLVFGQRANTGSWKIQDGILIIESPFDTLNYTEVQFSADTLILVQKDGASSLFIRKIEESCDAISLLNKLKDVSKVNFSEVADTIIEDGIQANYMTISVEVKDDFAVLGNAIKPMVDELPKIGFELDNELITEIQTGYFFKNYKLIVTNQFVSPTHGADQNSTEEGNASGVYEVIIICYCQ
jgi:hypothetical protein